MAAGAVNRKENADFNNNKKIAYRSGNLALFQNIG